VAELKRSAEDMKIRGGIRIGNLYESWPSAQLCFDSDAIVLRYRGEHCLKKEDLKVVSFLRGSFMTEVRIEHTSDVADSPIRFFPLFSRDAYAHARSLGLPCEEKRAPFYTKGDLIDMG